MRFRYDQFQIVSQPTAYGDGFTNHAESTPSGRAEMEIVFPLGSPVFRPYDLHTEHEYVLPRNRIFYGTARQTRHDPEDNVTHIYLNGRIEALDVVESRENRSAIGQRLRNLTSPSIAVPPEHFNSRSIITVDEAMAIHEAAQETISDEVTEGMAAIIEEYLHDACIDPGTMEVRSDDGMSDEVIVNSLGQGSIRLGNRGGGMIFKLTDLINALHSSRNSATKDEATNAPEQSLPRRAFDI